MVDKSLEYDFRIGASSELGSTSDSFLHSGGASVRTWVTSDSSLHSGGASVRTWVYFGLLSSFRRNFCPNLGLLRTPFFIQEELLSELGSTSDSFLHSGGFSVQTWKIFRQLLQILGILSLLFFQIPKADLFKKVCFYLFSLQY